ncbi:hypothetical protein SAMD00019534_008870 [Acytostelium subglobosum LB1]|uniref:hypothetical protein n=1 Tax=Acytostelium subglobosum LB1 TaxID=1410327 RepID=UPI000644F0F7|nr:hypothetical protein SAMD00019534_008870 [Acytostelium subglobosum LB1]GAM17712.1 hypothetical protein SAMD00019534_008870 [Acytostelium subglobosum LB1]|eukprot:XP_012758308.1 hypothetical protein SAMD00019534_008870 [Acytostelium subglobosum LB1]
MIEIDASTSTTTTTTVTTNEIPQQQQQQQSIVVVVSSSNQEQQQHQLLNNSNPSATGGSLNVVEMKKKKRDRRYAGCEDKNELCALDECSASHYYVHPQSPQQRSNPIQLANIESPKEFYLQGGSSSPSPLTPSSDSGDITTTTTTTTRHHHRSNYSHRYSHYYDNNNNIINDEDDVDIDDDLEDGANDYQPMEIDQCFSGDPLVTEVLRDEKETLSFMERRTIELESVELTISSLQETREAIRRDLKMKRMFLRSIQKKKEEHLKTISKSYYNIATRYNLSDARSLTLILPEEVMLHIFKFLSPSDLCLGVCRVSQKWRMLALDLSLWREICLSRRLLDGTTFHVPPPSYLRNQSIHNKPAPVVLEEDDDEDMMMITENHNGDKPEVTRSQLYNLQSPQVSQQTKTTTTSVSSGPVWTENWYIGEFRKDSNWRKGKYGTTILRGHKEIVWSLLYEPETNTLVSGSEDMTVKTWDCSRIGEGSQFNDDLEDSKRRCLRTMSGHKNGTICLGSTPNRIVSGSADGSIKIWDRLDGSCIDTIQTHSSVWCLQIVGNSLICGCVDGTMRVFDLNTSQSLRTMRGHTAPVRCLQAINHNGQDLVISGSYDKTIKVWDMDARCVNTIRAHTHKINCIQYENGQMVSGSHDSLLKVWDMNGQLIHTLQGHENMIHCLQFKGSKLLSGSTDSTIKLWDLKNGSLVNTIKGQSAVCCLKFNDSKLITGYEDSTIKIFDFSF